MAMDESELNQIYTAFAKDIYEGIRQQLKRDDGKPKTGTNHPKNESESDEEEPKLKNARLFSALMDDLRKLVKQETGMEDRVLGQIHIYSC